MELSWTVALAGGGLILTGACRADPDPGRWIDATCRRGRGRGAGGISLGGGHGIPGTVELRVRDPARLASALSTG